VALLVLSADVHASPRTTDIPKPRNITLLLYVETPHRLSGESLNAMKLELREMLTTPALAFQFISPENALPPAFFESLISVRLVGACNVNESTSVPAAGALAFAHSSDGRILPFVEVECDRVRSHVRGAFWGPDCKRSHYLYGRALARVLAHELYHVMTGRKQHTSTGLMRKALTGSQLISDEFELDDPMDQYKNTVSSR
jgi:hypothetical protein